jgi:hypothetical protein
MVIARVFVLLWFLVAFALSVTGWFERFSSDALFGIGAVVSAGGFAMLHWFSSRFRGFTRARGLKRLTRTQVLRLFGILALVKSHQHILPAIFAIPTGVIDIAFAITSFFVAGLLVSAKGAPQPGFFLWHFLGLLGLAVSVTLAVLTSSTRFGLSCRVDIARSRSRGSKRPLLSSIVLNVASRERITGTLLPASGRRPRSPHVNRESCGRPERP